jgi:hypothetical protein
MKAIALLLFFALPVSAQEHQHGSQVIRGQEQPNQISDSDAYRHFFLRTANTPLGHRGPLVQPDYDTLQTIVSAFKVEWDHRVAAYNAKATAVNKAGKRADLQQFLAERDAFVEETKTKLAEELSPRAMEAVAKIVQQSKQFMIVSGGLQTNNAPCVAYANSIAMSSKPVAFINAAEFSKPGDPSHAPMGMKYAVILDGATTMTVTTQACGETAADISAITHTPELSVKFGEAENSSVQKGSALCADCYIHAILTETYSSVVGVEFQVFPEAVIRCSYGGQIF